MADEAPKTLSVPAAGKRYYDLGRHGSYAAAARGDIPTIRVGRLLRVPIKPNTKPAQRRRGASDPVRS